MYTLTDHIDLAVNSYSHMIRYIMFSDITNTLHLIGYNGWSTTTAGHTLIRHPVNKGLKEGMSYTM